jgi:hypothetical protein
MTTTKAVLIVGFSILFLLLGFGSLLTYSAYEKGQAQFLALQGKRKEAIDLLQQQSDEDERRIKCDLIWQRYELAKLKAEKLRIEGKDVAYYNARKSLLGLEPICGSEMTLDQTMRLTIEQLDNAQKEEALRQAIKADETLGFKSKLKRTLMNLP